LQDRVGGVGAGQRGGERLQLGAHRAGVVGEESVDAIVGLAAHAATGVAVTGSVVAQIVAFSDQDRQFSVSDVMKERGLRSSWVPRRMLGVLT
jgi:hypothetical protein